jgi:hypothetical protein
MEFVDILNHVKAEQSLVDQLSTVGRHREILPEVVIWQRRVFLAEHHILDAHSKFSILVVARFV